MKNDIKNLTLDEKIELLTGYTEWDIHKIDKLDKFNMADGPCGLRKVSHWATGEAVHHRSTCYASPSVLANSWDKVLVKKASSAMADDCIDENVDMLLAPGINIKRDPRCGRNFEYMSEDPMLAGTLAKEYIDGLQEKGVGTSLKHYCCNNAEDNRQSCDSVVDKRTLMEIYTRNFYYACKAKPTTVMCAYNKVNGLWCSESKELNDILYNKLGFDGAIISDWEAVHNKIPSVKSGLALQMPYRKGMFEEVKKAYENGEITEEEIDLCAGRTIDLINKIQDMKPLRKVETNVNQRHDIAKEGVYGGAVLLKNNGVLPMKKGSKIGVTGLFVNNVHCGGGSAHVWNLWEVLDIDKTIKNADPTATVITEDFLIARQAKDTIKWNPIEDITKYFDGVDYAVIRIGTSRRDEGEGFDRDSIKLSPLTEGFINYVGDNFKGKTVVVLYAGSAIDVSSWIDAVDAVLLVGFGGEMVNQAATDILFGDVNPSGKLTETWPMKLEDISCLNRYNKYMTKDFYTDGVYVGYRHYDKNNITPRYEFGYGLSYSKFDYSDLSVTDLGDKLQVSYFIKNVSNVDGKEISQIYMYSPATEIDRPVKELIGYDKTLIKAGETVKINVTIDKEVMCYFDVNTDAFKFEKGTYQIAVGASSRDIKLREKIEL